MDNFIVKFFSCDFSDLLIDKREIYRYMGIKDECDENTISLVEECIKNVSNSVDLKLCYMFMPVKTENDTVNFEIFSIASKDLSKNIQNTEKCILYGATVGQGIDRLIARFSHISPVTALAYQAIGTEIIEKFCDKFEDFLTDEYKISPRPRFSPGYGDLSIKYQRKIFDILNLEKNCGITLNDSFIMRPSKSVTAFIAIGDCKNTNYNKCINCENKTCEYRKENV